MGATLTSLFPFCRVRWKVGGVGVTARKRLRTVDLTCTVYYNIPLYPDTRYLLSMCFCQMSLTMKMQWEIPQLLAGPKLLVDFLYFWGSATELKCQSCQEYVGLLSHWDIFENMALVPVFSVTCSKLLSHTWDVELVPVCFDSQEDSVISLVSGCVLPFLPWLKNAPPPTFLKSWTYFSLIYAVVTSVLNQK